MKQQTGILHECVATKTIFKLSFYIYAAVIVLWAFFVIKGGNLQGFLISLYNQCMSSKPFNLTKRDQIYIYTTLYNFAKRDNLKIITKNKDSSSLGHV